MSGNIPFIFHTQLNLFLAGCYVILLISLAKIGKPLELEKLIQIENKLDLVNSKIDKLLKK
jgi:hypothetical protein